MAVMAGCIAVVPASLDEPKTRMPRLPRTMQLMSMPYSFSRLDDPHAMAPVRLDVTKPVTGVAVWRGVALTTPRVGGMGEEG